MKAQPIDAQEMQMKARSIEAWCQMLALIREEAHDQRLDFMVYLIEITLEHARSLRILSAHYPR
jgi:hypothetical protein